MWMDILPWVGFVGFVLAVLAIDLGVFHREAHEVHRKEALAWVTVWVTLALIFNIGVYLVQGTENGLLWTTGYLIELSLSVDNVFVFILIFTTFAVPPQYRHRVLFWGILGALIMRATLIGAAGFLLHYLHFVIYLFGAFLIFTGIRFLKSDDHVPEIDQNPLIKFARRFFPVTETYEGQSFFVRRNGVRYITPLFLVLLLVESTDLVFAVDSIPAIYGVTRDPFIVFTSNVFAILGLRAMYFVLAGYLGGLRYLKPGLAAILTFVGVKMVLSDVIHLPPWASLIVIVGILGAALGASIRVQKREQAAGEAIVAPPH